MSPFAIAIPLALTFAATLPSWMQRAEVATGADESSPFIARVQFHGPVDADQEVPPADSNAHGHVRVVVKDNNTFEVHVVVTNLSGPATGAHLHLGEAGTTGPIVVDLTDAITQQNSHVVKIDGTFEPSDIIGEHEGDLEALLEALSEGNIYFNVHTEEFPAGEARGQL